MDKERYFQHFKGGVYKLLAIARDSETLENVAVYQALYGDQQIWVRPEKMFRDSVNINGREIPRFKELTKNDALCLLKKTGNI